jgi:hypothetical protein
MLELLSLVALFGGAEAFAGIPSLVCKGLVMFFFRHDAPSTAAMSSSAVWACASEPAKGFAVPSTREAKEYVGSVPDKLKPKSKYRIRGPPGQA